MLWFSCIPNGIYKEDNPKAGNICPPLHMWNKVKKYPMKIFSDLDEIGAGANTGFYHDLLSTSIDGLHMTS